MGFSFVLLLFSALMLILLLFFTIRVEKKTQSHYVFLLLLLAMIIWTVGNIFAWYTFHYSNRIEMAYVKLWYLGNCYVPVLLYFFSLTYHRYRVSLSAQNILIVSLPTISYLTLATNEINGHLFFRHFSLINSEVVFGPFFYLHTLVSYLFIGMALYHLLSFSIKNSGLFSRQSLLTLIAALCPAIINVIITLKLFNLPVYYTSIGFSVVVLIFWFSIVKYQFLSLTPIAMQTVIDRMSDGFAVVNEDCRIIYYNRSFVDTFKSLNPKQMDNLCDVFKSYGDNFSEKLHQHLCLIKASSGMSLSFDQELVIANDKRHFNIEVTPFLGPENKVLWGILVFFKDTTQIQKAIETIKRNQAMLLEQQHLASLGQLIGGIAHNLRTPIMSIAGGLESLRDLVNEYQLSIGDESVTPEDHHEIASEMLQTINKTKPFCSYMSDIISTVKDQAVRLSDSSMNKFIVGELLKRVELLMKHELKKGHCTLTINNRVPSETEIPGTMNNMIQIIGNIIVNAIDAYEEKEGKIDLTVEFCNVHPGNVLISIRDYGPGLPASISNRIFKEMITTKGKKGTGLGLYLSNITIKGKFGGEMWFESKKGQGTTFYLSIPAIKIGEQEKRA